MNRLEAMREYLRPYAVRQLERKIAEIKDCSSEVFIKQMKNIFHRAGKVQKEYPQWRPEAVCLLHLMTGLVTGSYEYQILLSDKQLYLDKLQVTGYWRPEIFQEDSEDKEALKKHLSKRFIHLTDYEISYMKRWVFYECRMLPEVFWSLYVDEIRKTEEFCRLEKGERFLFLAGDYMGELKVCGSNSQEEK